MEGILIVISLACFALVGISCYNLGKESANKHWLFKAEDDYEVSYAIIQEQEEQIERLKKRIDYLKSFRYNEAIIDADFDEDKGEEK